MNREQRGFSLLAAIFILVVLGLLASYMVRLSGTQRTTTLFAVQGARAYQAARAGVEWAITRIGIDNDCSNVDGTSLSLPGLSGFSVVLACNRQPFTEVNTINVFTVTSTSESGSYSGVSYINRQLQVTLFQ